jgi:hypothetical protein
MSKILKETIVLLWYGKGRSLMVERQAKLEASNHSVSLRDTDTPIPFRLQGVGLVTPLCSHTERFSGMEVGAIGVFLPYIHGASNLCRAS